jgi:hypothetical protein
MLNFYNYTKKEKVINPNYDKHRISIPSRICVASGSGTGKSNCVMNLIYLFNKTFHEIILCVKSSDEPLYNLLENKLSNVIIYEGGEVPPLTDFSLLDERTNKIKRIDKKQRLIIFDDLMLDKNANKIACEYYIKARKLGFTMIYISQSFFQIPKIIRDNCNYFILGKNLLKRDLRTILTCFPTDLSLDEFIQLYNELTEEPLSVIMINLDKRMIYPNITGSAIKI